MRMPSSVFSVARIILILVVVAGSVALTGSSNRSYSPHDRAYYADPALVAFVRPGLSISINSANISSSGAITVTYTLSDPMGLPLDASGVTTPGVVSLAYVAAYIPAGQQQYVALTTAQATGAVLGTITRPDFELQAPDGGNTPTPVGPGQYQYTFKAQAPAGFDPTTTYTVAVDGNRDLTSFDLGTNYAGTTFNFVPNGAPVTLTRDVIRTVSCNRCHDSLAFHGGYAQTMNMCVMCHQPQNADPVTGNSLDAKVFFHKLHMGSSLPSVLGYTAGSQTVPPAPYEIIGYMNSVNNFSTVVDPAMAQRCEVCHALTTGAAQATAFLLQPTRAACGSCHDNVNFATGVNHPGGFQTDDSQCAECHVPQGEHPFDASILGAHVVPGDTPAAYPPNPDPLIASVVVNITGVTNGNAGQNPTVAFTIQDINNNPLALSALAALEFTMAGPTTDYGYTSFGSDVTTPGYVTEDASKNSTCDANSNCTYAFTHAVPANATGSYAIGVESTRTETVEANTTTQMIVTTGTPNQVTYFSVDGSTVAPRRTVVEIANCNQCHQQLILHGNRRNNTEYCVLCHNPSNTDASTRAIAVVASYQSQPPQGINFSLLVHNIHNGVNAATDDGGPKYPYIVVGYMGSINNFSGTLYPAMNGAGEATYMGDCSLCHVNDSEANLPTALNQVVDPQGWINPTVGPDSAACSGCHVSKVEAAHFLANTDSLGESCDVCHASGAQFSVNSVHTP